MLALDQIKQELSKYDEKLQELGDSLNIEEAKSKIEELEETAGDPDFWNDMDSAQKILQQTKHLKDKVEGFNSLRDTYEEILLLVEMGNEENDESYVPEAKDMKDKFLQRFEELRISTLLTGEYDNSNCIVTLHSGAGGTEACDWTSMLYRMYGKWCDSHGFTAEELDFLAGDEAGIKSVTFRVEGENAYGLLKSEKGIHRLVRISPFDAAKKRHTSFASCDVMPEIDDDIDFEINPDDIEMQVFRSSGAGGQHINKTSSAVRLIHKPTGVVVSCQTQRSQLQNRETCMKMLKSKLYEMEREKQMEKLADIRGEVKKIEWGSQIRSYVFQPYTMVKDIRTEEETGNISAVMDGKIDNFINAYLKWINT
ncbi:MAG: peptide chain release factor 2 [Eubacterium sp.]|nr:peptide chain release factor 2 [Eubacterium sp.]